MSGNELTSALNAYLSHFPNADEKLKKDIADTLKSEVQRYLDSGSFSAFSGGPNDQRTNDKFRFIQEYLKSIGFSTSDAQHNANSGTMTIRFERARQESPDLASSVMSSGTFADQVSKTVDRIAGDTVRLYGLGSNPKVLTSDLNALQKIADRLSGDNDISFTDVGLEHAKFIPQATIPDQNGRSHADPDRPARWELSLEQAVKAGIVEGLKFQSLSERKAPEPVSHPHPTYGSGRLSTSARARQATAQTPWEQSGNVDRSAVFTGRAIGDIPDLNNPPRWDSGGVGGIPPGGNDPPQPPDDPEDNDGILRQLLEFFQRMFGVRPDIANHNFLDTLANNLTTILGGIPRQAGEDGPPSAFASLMDTVADYFNVPRETEEATREAQENLRRSIDRLTEATNGAANGGNPQQPQTRWQRFRSFFRRGRTRRGGIATATRIASYMRPVLSRIGNIIPARWRQAAGQAGVNMVTQVGGRFGIPAATAARFGAALGPAAVGIGVLAYGIPLVGAAIKATISGLNRLAESALQTTFALASYSGLLAHANAQLELNREMRKFDMANRMGGLGAERLNQVNRLENAMQPWNEAGNQIGNLWGTATDAILSTILEAINNLVAIELEIKAAILDLIPGDQGEAMFRKEADRLRNPGANLPQAFEGRDALFGQNAVDMIDLGKRLAGPRKPVNGGN